MPAIHIGDYVLKLSFWPQDSPKIEEKDVYKKQRTKNVQKWKGIIFLKGDINEKTQTEKAKERVTPLKTFYLSVLVGLLFHLLSNMSYAL